MIIPRTESFPVEAAPRRRSRIRRFFQILLVTGVLAFLLDLLAGTWLIAPRQKHFPIPVGIDYTVEPVTFPSESGATVQGWLIPAANARAVVILMHGVHADRTTMLERVPFLHAAGYTLLLFDFQAHGETVGKHITFGYLESRDATAAVAFARQKFPDAKIGVLGVSMGGAAALLAQPPLPVAAMIVESAYPTIEQAIDDRLVVRLGPWGKYGARLLTWQLRPRLGFGVEDLCPIRSVANITVPKFFMAGDKDRNTTLAESQALFAAAAEPKQLWIVPGAGHVDLHHFARAEYEQRVLAFLREHLGGA